MCSSSRPAEPDEAVGPPATVSRRPLRLLLVSDDGEFAGRVLVRAATLGLSIAHVGSADDLELAAFCHGANVVVLDADGAPWRRSRTASAFASSYPDVVVALAATSPAVAASAGLPLVGKDSAEDLLHEIDRVRQRRLRVAG